VFCDQIFCQFSIHRQNGTLENKVAASYSIINWLA